MNPWRELPTIEDLIRRLDQAYVADDLVSTRRWRILLAALFVTIAGTAIAILLLASGAANVPQFTNPLLNLRDTDELPFVHSTNQLRLQDFDISLEAQFTLDLSALNRRPDSAWGAWIGSPDAGLMILIHSDGYFSAEPIGQPPEWRRFHHIRANEINALRVHQTVDEARLYINQEFAFSLPTSTGSAGPVLWNNPQLEWQTLSIYSP